MGAADVVVVFGGLSLYVDLFGRFESSSLVYRPRAVVPCQVAFDLRFLAHVLHGFVKLSKPAILHVAKRLGQMLANLFERNGSTASS